MSATAIPVRRIAPSNIVDAETLMSMDEEDGLLGPDPSPGDTILDLGDGSKDSRFTATYEGTDIKTHATVYDVEGRAFPMPIDVARARLQKRYPANHSQYPNQRVFYPKPPREVPVATIPCKAEWHYCRKMFYSLRQRDVHFRNRHETEHRERTESDAIDRQERAILAQERQADLMAQLLAGQTGGAMPVPAAALSDPLSAFEDSSSSLSDEEDDEPTSFDDELFHDGVPDVTWKITEIRAWMEREGVALPTKVYGINKVDLLAHIRDEQGR